MDADVERELGRLDKRIMALEVVNVKLVALEVEVRGIVEDVRELKMAITRRAEERAGERESSRKERKSDRRWLVGTVLTTGMLVVAALAVLLQGAGP